jgi:ribosomal-protein-alanine N-acetyltransferase
VGEAGGGVSLVIAAAAMEDVADIVALERGAVEAPHWPEAMYRAIVAETGEGELRRCLLVAKDDGELAGFAVGRVLGVEAELESVAVRSSVRRMGVGRALCGAVMAWAREQGAHGMEREVRASSAGAISLYDGMGFAVVGRRPEYYAGPVEDAVLMRVEYSLSD